MEPLDRKLDTGSRSGDEAVEAATQLNDAGLHGFALWARHYSAWRPDNLRERTEISTRLVAFAEQTGDPIVTAWASSRGRSTPSKRPT